MLIIQLKLRKFQARIDDMMASMRTRGVYLFLSCGFPKASVVEVDVIPRFIFIHLIQLNPFILSYEKKRYLVNCCSSINGFELGSSECAFYSGFKNWDLGTSQNCKPFKSLGCSSW